MTFSIPAPLVLHRWKIVCNSFDPARLGTAWLRSYASYIRTALASEPALLEKFISGAADHDGETEYIADALEALHFQGLEPDEAPTVCAAVTAMAMGGVSEGHRERVHTEQGRPWLARIFAVTARSAPIEFPTLRAVARSGYDPLCEDASQQRLTLLFKGIAAQ